jgi:DNA-binding response OmpR family regulator
LDQGVELLTKPFTRAQLITRVRAVLDAPVVLESATMKVAIVIDDEVLISMYLADVLEEAGFTVVQSQSARDGLAALEAAPQAAIAFVDIGLPDRNGLELATEIRERFPSVKIAIASGYNDPSMTLRNDPKVVFLPKPFDAAAIKRTLRTLALD